jgi:tetratricopeptide (TPR) repeat protein
MKFLRAFLSVIIFFSFHQSNFATVQSNYIDRKYDPLLVVVIMVKDETDVIKPTLEMYCKADPEGKKIAYIVYDTGLDPWSSTMAKAKELFNEYHLTNYYIIQEPFVDFATSRNKALDLVERNFPNAAFMLMPDAEWYLHGVPELLEFCEAELAIPSGALSYLVRIVSTDLDFGTQRLIRCRHGMRFAGVVHETIMIGTRFKTPDSIFFELRPGRYGVEKTQKRFKRDRELLLKAFESNQKDSRSAFYLAQTCDCIGNLDEAYKYYSIRITLPGWDEEDMMARYRLAQVTERMKNEDGSSRWPEALDHYLKAYTMRPSRVEGLIRVAAHYLNEGNHACAYLFIKRACDVVYPKCDTLFVEKEGYECTRWDILGQCAWYVGEFQIGEEAVRQALKVHENYPHLLNNLSYYINKRIMEGRIAT